jgi:hypothetical protein
LADAIRDKAPECPIVLVTRESILEELTPQRRRQLTERLQVFDELILKDQIDSDLAQVQHLLKSMSEGYHALRESPDKTWKALTDVLGASIGELEILGEAAPPLEDNLWITTGIAYWIRNVVLEFPGVVYSPIYAATRLGISVDSFESEQVQELLKPAKYSGIFDPLEGRWWKERLSQIASDLSAETGVRGPTNRVFLQAFEKKFSLELSPALCIWDHTPTADQVCYLLRQPVKTRNSLRYYPDRRPEVMDNARVSFLAIQNDVKFNEAYLDPESLGLLERILEQSQP